MTVRVGQSASVQGSGNAATTGAVTTAASGSTFIIAYVHGNGANPTPTDSKSNAYSSVANIIDTNDGTQLSVWIKENGTGGASHTATVSGVDSAAPVLAFVEILEAPTSSVQDATATTLYVASGTPIAQKITTVTANDLVLSFVTDGGAVSATITATPGSHLNRLVHQVAAAPGTLAIGSVLIPTPAPSPPWSPHWTFSAGSSGAMVVMAIKDTGPVITGTSPVAFDNNQASVVISGSRFGGSTGTVKISPSDNIADGSVVSQTVTAWADTSITITAAIGSIGYNPAWLFVTTNGGQSNSIGFPVDFQANATTAWMGQ